MKSSLTGAIFIGLISLLSFGANAADIEAGKSKSVTCGACHGADGNSTNPIWPSLAGQHANYIVKQLKDFKAGNRIEPTMQGMAATLSDADMEDVAAYYQSQELKSVSFNGELIEQGQDIYRGGITDASIAACMACHSPSGDGIAAAGWPSLKGQHPEYIVAQLKSFQTGARANDEGEMMRGVAARMSLKEMEAVAAYLAGIQ